VTGARVLAYFSQNPCIQQENSSNISFICIGLRFFQEALIIPIFDAGRFFGSLFMSFFTRDQATAAPITADFPALLLSMLIYILIAAVVYLLSQGIYWLYDLAKPDSDSAQDQ
jgi:ABC-type uncharacterized transport system permease subunit